ncbi:MAG TPA: DUF3276 family protein [Bacteroidota bacterium]|nr:DUF3276 family protein [Bacteroidota bacterium]
METGESLQGGEAGNSGQENVFSRRVRAGKRTYFFDVKATKSVKDLYIVITESRRVSEEKYEKHKIFLYKEDFSKFIDAITETSQFVERELLERTAEPS